MHISIWEFSYIILPNRSNSSFVIFQYTKWTQDLDTVDSNKECYLGQKGNWDKMAILLCENLFNIVTLF